MLALLPGYSGLRRSELVHLTMEHLQRREEHWAIIDLVGKGGHVRTVPIPTWVKQAIDIWCMAADIKGGRLFRCVNKTGAIWGRGITEKVVWCMVRECASKARLDKISAPRSAANMCATMSRVRWRVGADSVLAGACQCTNNGTLFGLQAKVARSSQ